MDSRLIAGAYSQQYKAVQENEVNHFERADSIARARKLSQETNKRRKLQAHKRKLEAKREERRRQDILAKRREEQNVATERYQRSHIPTSSRPPSGRFFNRTSTGNSLEDALRLVRASPALGLSKSNQLRENLDEKRKHSPIYKEENPLERTYTGHTFHNNSNRPGSAKASGIMDPSAHARLMDCSMQNYANSRSLFEHQLEQQQNFLLNEHQKALTEFNEALNNEIKFQKNEEEFAKSKTDESDERAIVSSDSCSSLDSLEAHADHRRDTDIQSDQASQTSSKNQKPNEFLRLLDNNTKSNHDINRNGLSENVSTIEKNYQKEPALIGQPGLREMSSSKNVTGSNHPYVGLTRADLINETADDNHQKYPFKQFSADSLVESTSSCSSIHLEKETNKQIKPEITDLKDKTQNPASDLYLGGSSNFKTVTSSVEAWVSDTQQAKKAENHANPTSVIPMTEVCVMPSTLSAQNISGNNLNSYVTSPLWPRSNTYAPSSSSISSTTPAVKYISENTGNTNLTPSEIGKPKVNSLQISLNPLHSSNPKYAPSPSSEHYNTLENMNDLKYYSMKQQNSNYDKMQPNNLGPRNDNASIMANLQREIEIMSEKALQNQGYLTNNLSPGLSHHESSMKPTSALTKNVQDDPQQNISMNSVQKYTPNIVVPVAKTEKLPSDTKTKELSTLSSTNIQLSSSPLDPPQGNSSQPSYEAESQAGKRLKGILKQLDAKTTDSDNKHGIRGTANVRDSLELVKTQNSRKEKKKSVRFAENISEEKSNFSYLSSYRRTTSRPSSAKTTSNSTLNSNNNKVQRSPSADSLRQASFQNGLRMVSVHQHSGFNGESATNVSIATTSNSSSKAFNSTFSNSSPLNRPKAVAHIIMSPDNPGSGSPAENPSNHATVAHKSHLESKVKPVTNNFMSKVPVKLPQSNNNTSYVYQAQTSETNSQKQVHTNKPENGLVRTNQDNPYVNGGMKFQDSSITKNAPSYSRPNIVPVSTKINLSPTLSSTPLYGVNNNAVKTPVYNENGIRIDRTPTDEEITWLWDKVRNCLDKQEDKGNPSKTVPMLSTKVIDGAALGIGVGKPETVQNPPAKVGNMAAVQFKPKPVSHQGSYLKRFGLLQQRRTYSATPNGKVNKPMIQRTASATINRQPTVPPPSSQYEPTPPSPMAFGYRPQEEVSESTAAFMVAENLSKHSISDSHIQQAMEDAKMKQELYNSGRTRLTPFKGSPSSLSLEERRLMESLDKLNDRLRVTEQKYPSTIPYQHKPSINYLSSRNYVSSTTQELTPRSQQYDRIRQQIRQYR